MLALIKFHQASLQFLVLSFLVIVSVLERVSLCCITVYLLVL